MKISTKVDYAVRAVTEIAHRGNGEFISVECIASEQGIPERYLMSVLVELRTRGIVSSQRGVKGGFRLARPADLITVADIIMAMDGQIITVGDVPADMLAYTGTSAMVGDVWAAMCQMIQRVVNVVTVQSMVDGVFPPELSDLTRKSLGPAGAGPQ